MTHTAMLLSGGWFVFLLFLVAMFFVLGHALYTRTGSAIDKHPYSHPPIGAPGAAIPDEYSDYMSFEEQILGRRPKRWR